MYDIFWGRVGIYTGYGTPADEALAAFAKGAGLLLYDAQYAEEEYEAHRGFGHSTAQKGLALMDACGAGRMLLVHHSPRSTDAELAAREEQIGREGVRFAREGETIVL